MGSPRKRSKTAPRPPTKPKRVGRGASSYVHFEGLLSPAQLERARAFTASEPVQDALEKAELFNGPGASRDRKSRVAWLDRAGHSDEDSERAIYPTWLHNRLRDCARETHHKLGDKWCPIGLDRNGRWTPRYEPLQYAEYGPGGHYGSWHTDAELGDEDPEDARCITVVVLLSDTANFTGGHLEVRLGGEHRKPSRVPLRAGDAIGFPARRLWHRVTTCKSGLRQSIVFWVRHNEKPPETRFDDEDEAGDEESPSKAA